MVTKTLTITQSAYDKLLANKQEKESFSQVIERIIPQKKKTLLDFAGTLSEKEAEAFKTRITQFRKEMNEEFDERQKRFGR